MTEAERPGASISWSSFKKAALGFSGYVAALVLIFFLPLGELLGMALEDDLYSHILIVPGVSLFLMIWERERWWGKPMVRPATNLILLAAGALMVMGLIRAVARTPDMLSRDVLAVEISGFVALLQVGFVVCFGRNAARAVLFPLFFLFFMVPLPTPWEHAIEDFFVQTSGVVAFLMFQLLSTPVHRDGPLLVLPGLTLEVARECSGIHSSLVLFITGLLAGYLLLRTWPVRSLLALCVIPVGIFRNAFRITVLALLTLHVDPDIIKGPLHRQGGPIFFALSLLLLGAILLLLRRVERRPEPFPGTMKRDNQ